VAASLWARVVGALAIRTSHRFSFSAQAENAYGSPASPSLFPSGRVSSSVGTLMGSY